MASTTPDIVPYDPEVHDGGHEIDKRAERKLLLKLDALILPLTALLYLSALYVPPTSELTQPRSREHGECKAARSPRHIWG